MRARSLFGAAWLVDLAIVHHEAPMCECAARRAARTAVMWHLPAWSRTLQSYRHSLGTSTVHAAGAGSATEAVLRGQRRYAIVLNTSHRCDATQEARRPHDHRHAHGSFAPSRLEVCVR
jgi:hypothetical protein